MSNYGEKLQTLQITDTLTLLEYLHYLIRYELEYVGGPPLQTGADTEDNSQDGTTEDNSQDGTTEDNTTEDIPSGTTVDDSSSDSEEESLYSINEDDMDILIFLLIINEIFFHGFVLKNINKDKYFEIINTEDYAKLQYKEYWENVTNYVTTAMFDNERSDSGDTPMTGGSLQTILAKAKSAASTTWSIINDKNINSAVTSMLGEPNANTAVATDVTDVTTDKTGGACGCTDTINETNDDTTGGTNNDTTDGTEDNTTEGTEDNTAGGTTTTISDIQEIMGGLEIEAGTGSHVYEDKLQRFIQDIYLDLTKEAKEHNETIQNWIATVKALSDVKFVFLSSAEKRKNILIPEYEKIMYPKQYSSTELQDYKPTEDVIKAYNSWMMCKCFSDMWNKITLYKEYNFEIVEGVEKLILKNKN